MLVFLSLLFFGFLSFEDFTFFFCSVFCGLELEAGETVSMGSDTGDGEGATLKSVGVTVSAEDGGAVGELIGVRVTGVSNGLELCSSPVELIGLGVVGAPLGAAVGALVGLGVASSPAGLAVGSFVGTPVGLRVAIAPVGMTVGSDLGELVVFGLIVGEATKFVQPQISANLDSFWITSHCSSVTMPSWESCLVKPHVAVTSWNCSGSTKKSITGSGSVMSASGSPQ